MASLFASFPVSQLSSPPSSTLQSPPVPRAPPSSPAALASPNAAAQMTSHYDQPIAVIDHAYPQQQQQGYNRAALEAAEMTAFEKGRMAGEMEALRRHEAEAPLKVMAPTNQEILAAQALANKPDVIEINRLTWVQRLSAGMAELTGLTSIVLAVYWLHEYRGNVGWTNSTNNGDEQMYSTGLLTFVLGLFLHGNAISNYRMLPLNTNPGFLRAWYIGLTLATVTCYVLTLVTLIMTPPDFEPFNEAQFWSVSNWCFLMAMAVFIPYAFYSMGRALLDGVWPVDYETWSETSNNIDAAGKGWGQRLGPDHNARNKNIAANGLDAEGDRRTLYTAAPVAVSRGRNLPAANANVGAEVPVAPSNAPRWAESPRTHAEDYFLLARAKWANVAFWSMGAAFLMILAEQQAVHAAGRGTWAQGAAHPTLNEAGAEAVLIGVLGLVVLAGLLFFSYSAMPPRTTLVKNGIIAENRRPSISHNADTRLDHNIV